MVSCWLSVCLSVHPSVVLPFVHFFRFQMITRVNVNGFSLNSVCALILWRSGLGLFMGKFCQFLPELYARDMSAFSFLGDNFKYLDFHQTVCALKLQKSCLGLLMGKFHQFLLRVNCPQHVYIFISGW